MRQNAEAILALTGFKRVIKMVEYQQLMPDPSDYDTRCLISASKRRPRSGFPRF